MVHFPVQYFKLGSSDRQAFVSPFLKLKYINTERRTRSFWLFLGEVLVMTLWFCCFGDMVRRNVMGRVGGAELFILWWPKCRNGETLSCKARAHPTDLHTWTRSHLLEISPLSNNDVTGEPSFNACSFGT